MKYITAVRGVARVIILRAAKLIYQLCTTLKKAINTAPKNVMEFACGGVISAFFCAKMTAGR